MFYQEESKFTKISAACLSDLIGSNLTWLRQSFCHVTHHISNKRKCKGSAMMSLFISHVYATIWVQTCISLITEKNANSSINLASDFMHLNSLWMTILSVFWSSVNKFTLQNEMSCRILRLFGFASRTSSHMHRRRWHTVVSVVTTRPTCCLHQNHIKNKKSLSF